MGKLILLSVKQNLGEAWSLGPPTLGKLTPLSIKQNLGRAWSLGPHTLGKLILSAKQNLGHAWSLGPHTLGKLILLSVTKYSAETWFCIFTQAAYFELVFSFSFNVSSSEIVDCVCLNSSPLVKTSRS